MQNLQQHSRLGGLDVLRAVAILLVLLSHGPRPEAGELPWLIEQLMLGLKRGGWIGVDLFFVLSGFLVSGLLMREHQKHGKVRVGRFLVRRGWKIYPPLILLVVYMTVHDYLTLGYWPINRLIHQSLFIQNYVPGMANHTWSIAVEEHAYLLIALAVFGSGLFATLRKRQMSLRWLAWSFPVIAIGCLIARISVMGHNGYNHYVHLFPTHHRLDSLMVGVVIAYLYHYHHAKTAEFLQRYRLIFAAAGLVLIAPPFVWSHLDHPWIYTYGLITNYLGGAALVCATIAWQPGKSPLARAMTAIGQHSYSIYLWHVQAYVLLMWLLLGTYDAYPVWQAPYVVKLLTYVGVTITFGIVMSYCVEVPTLRLRDRLSPSRSGALQPAGQRGSTGEASGDYRTPRESGPMSRAWSRLWSIVRLCTAR